MTTYGPWLSKDPCLWGDRAQGEWAGNSYVISNHVIVCQAGESGHTFLQTPFALGNSGTFEVVGRILNTGDGSGFRPLVYGTLGPELKDAADSNGDFAVTVEVSSATSDFFGLRSTGDGNAQICVDSVNGRFDFREIVAA